MKRNRSSIPLAVCAALWMSLLVSGCRSPGVLAPGSTVQHKVIGVWSIVDGGNELRREFTVDGKCILYRGRPVVDKSGKRIQYLTHGEAYQVCDFRPVDSRRVYVIRPDRRKERVMCEVLDDGRLSVEGRRIATRVE